MRIDNRLVWKYFFEQKSQELIKFFGIVFLLPFIILKFILKGCLDLLKAWWKGCYFNLGDIMKVTGGIFFANLIFSMGVGLEDMACAVGSCKYDWTYANYSFSIIIGFILLSLLFYWLQQNWEQAKKRVRKEMKPIRKIKRNGNSK